MLIVCQKNQWDGRQRITVSTYFDPFSGPKRRKLLFESNLPALSITVVNRTGGERGLPGLHCTSIFSSFELSSEVG